MAVQIVRIKNNVQMTVDGRTYTGSITGWNKVDVNGYTYLGLGTESSFGSARLWNKAWVEQQFFYIFSSVSSKDTVE